MGKDNLKKPRDKKIKDIIIENRSRLVIALFILVAINLISFAIVAIVELMPSSLAYASITNTLHSIFGICYTITKQILEHALVSLIIIIVLLYAVDIKEFFTKDDISSRVSNLREQLTNGSNGQKDKDILDMMLSDMEEIHAYYKISKRQAWIAFVFAIITSIVGFCLIIAGMYLLFNMESAIVETTKEGTGFNYSGIGAALTALGGVIAEFISASAMMLHKNTINQLETYYRALHDNERFLSIVHIGSKVSPEKQDEMYFEIVRNQLGAGNRTTDKDKK